MADTIRGTCTDLGIAFAEQIPVLYYYLPNAGALKYNDAIGVVDDPQVMDWRDALDRLRASRADTSLRPLLDRLPVGRRLFVFSPITENPRSWRAPWTELVRRRSAQYGGIVDRDPRFGGRCLDLRM